MVEPTVLMTGIDGAESTSLITMNGNTIVEALKNEEEDADEDEDEEAEWEDNKVDDVITVLNILVQKVCNRINYSNYFSIQSQSQGDTDESDTDESDTDESETETKTEKEEDVRAHPISAFEKMRDNKTVDDSDIDSDDERKHYWITQRQFKENFNMDIAIAANVIMRLKEDNVTGLNSDNESLHGDDSGDDSDDCEAVDALIKASQNSEAVHDNEDYADYACTAKQFILQDGKSVRNPYYLTYKERRAMLQTEKALKRSIAVRELAFENRNQKNDMLKFQHACEHVLAGFWGIADASRCTGIAQRTLRRGMNRIILTDGIAGTMKPGRPSKIEMLELEKNKDELTWFNWSKAKDNSPHWSRKEDGTAMEPETSYCDAVPERYCPEMDAIARRDGMTNICLLSPGMQL
jgi:ribosomal protein S25